MSEPTKEDKAEESTKSPKRQRKPVEYQRFEKMLKQVLKAPPLKKSKD